MDPMPAVIALVLLLVFAAPAAAASPVVRLVECGAQARTADFEGDMKAIAGTRRMQMRFTVEALPAGPSASWQRVEAPNLDTWISALPGRLRYVYTKHVEGLQPGVSYRVAVRFRWRAADGSVLRTALRRSDPCKVPDPRPDLVPVAIDVEPGTSADTRTYVLTLANKGRAAAPASSASFDAGQAALADQPVPALDPGARFKVSFDGPACVAGDTLAGTVDATGLVDEAVEADDLLTVPCPGT
ncbi:MAG: hypothetical protein QOE86_3421 [Solirubrobacteraceae bacterium]|jgi:hypothetical protein|nr:hypothetical protein [Solirubrobacteraceae bacterium]